MVQAGRRLRRRAPRSVPVLTAFLLALAALGLALLVPMPDSRRVGFVALGLLAAALGALALWARGRR